MSVKRRKANLMNKFTVSAPRSKQPCYRREFLRRSQRSGRNTVRQKLVTQLFGDRMMIANVRRECPWRMGNSVLSTPYTTNADGHAGPAWGTAFEDNAE